MRLLYLYLYILSSKLPNILISIMTSHKSHIQIRIVRNGILVRLFYFILLKNDGR